MAADPPLSLFLAASPGLEPQLLEEARALGFADPRAVRGGVEVAGDWAEAMRANLSLRCAGRVLARVAAFRAPHLAQLDRRARRLPWGDWLRPDRPFRVEATSRGSRIWHAGAAARRIAGAIADSVGAPEAVAGAAPGPAAEVRPAALSVMLRIADDLCTLSLDTSGEALHRRGFKQAVGKAPLRETMAAALLRACGWDGAAPLVDPMCGAGTFVIEAAEIAAGLSPGRARAFAFEDLAPFDAAAWAALRAAAAGAVRPAPAPVFGMDRDAGAVASARANAARAGVEGAAHFACQPVSALVPPPGTGAGLVIANPPYGERIGDRGDLHALHAAFGRVLRARFGGWRAAIVTSEPGLAAATGLPFGPPGPPIPHGPLKVRLYATPPLP